MESTPEPSVEAIAQSTPDDYTAAIARSAQDDYAALLDRLKTFAIVFLSVVIDLLFLGVWVLIHYWFGILMHYLVSPTVGLNLIAATALEYIFTISTLAIVVLYVVADFVGSARRIWKKAV
jgi:hypothetical protein